MLRGLRAPLLAHSSPLRTVDVTMVRTRSSARALRTPLDDGDDGAQTGAVRATRVVSTGREARVSNKEASRSRGAGEVEMRGSTRVKKILQVGQTPLLILPRRHMDADFVVPSK
mmetsp:Transcript_27976/g.50025  ORF Transcript_27976/g.50025 Transcript_27976/m.50025 type:complete len:114 (-) Transcript_27976:19-360(-)